MGILGRPPRFVVAGYAAWSRSSSWWRPRPAALVSTGSALQKFLPISARLKHFHDHLMFAQGFGPGAAAGAAALSVFCSWPHWSHAPWAGS